jgi:hypothetical protein
MSRRAVVAVAFALCIVLLAATGDAWAGAISPCREPFAYDSAVNVYVLEDATRSADDGLRDARKRLAWLVKLDALFRDSYGSLGVHFLWQMPGGQPCTLDQVIERTLRELQPGSAAAFVDQHVYREADQILVQSYVRFFRTDRARMVRPEMVVLSRGDGHSAFAELLPSQRLAFPPQTLTIFDLAAIEEAFSDASLIYPEPRAVNGRKLPLSADQPIPFLVSDVRPGGWMRIDASPFQGDLRGWLHADPRISAQLRERLPEYEFLEGIVGYLSWLQARDGHKLRGEAANSIGQRAGEVLGRYIAHMPQTQNADASTSLAAALRAAMAFDDPKRAGAVLPSLVGAVQYAVPDSRMRDLLGMARLAACCRRIPIPEGDADRAVWFVGLAGALNDFQGALAIDPGNDRALANLEVVYNLLGQADHYPASVRIASVPPALREAYDRAVPRLPRSRSDLDTRISEIRSLRGEVPKLPNQ